MHLVVHRITVSTPWRRERSTSVWHWRLRQANLVVSICVLASFVCSTSISQERLTREESCMTAFPVGCQASELRGRQFRISQPDEDTLALQTQRNAFFLRRQDDTVVIGQVGAFEKPWVNFVNEQHRHCNVVA